MKRITNDRIGTTLRAMRVRKNMSLTDVSDATGIDASLLSRIETGAIADIKLRTMVKLASALDFRLDAFAADSGLSRIVGKPAVQPGMSRAEFDEIIVNAQEIVDHLNTLRKRSKKR